MCMSVSLCVCLCGLCMWSLCVCLCMACAYVWCVVCVCLCMWSPCVCSVYVGGSLCVFSVFSVCVLCVYGLCVCACVHMCVVSVYLCVHAVGAYGGRERSLNLPAPGVPRSSKEQCVLVITEPSLQPIFLLAKLYCVLRALLL